MTTIAQPCPDATLFAVIAPGPIRVINVVTGETKDLPRHSVWLQSTQPLDLEAMARDHSELFAKVSAALLLEHPDREAFVKGKRMVELERAAPAEVKA